jgi:putative copper resistance protein D
VKERVAARLFGSGRRRSTRFVAAAAGAAVVALAIGLWIGDELPKSDIPAGFVDPGAATNLGLPFSRLVVDLSAIGTAGMLLTAILVPRTDGTLSDAARRCLTSAARSALVWAVATLVWLLFYWSDLLAVPVIRLPVAQLFHGAALSFPEAVRFMVAAAVALIVALGAIVTRSAWGAGVLLLLTGYNLLPFTTTGHAEHSPVIAYALTGHVFALVLWVGGLAGLLIHVRRSPALLAVAVPRFSALALACYVVVGGTGVVMAWLNLGAPAELWRSRYGVLVLGLAAAQAMLGIFGWWHRRHAVRAVAERRSSGAFIRLAAAEAVIMACAVAFGVALSRATTPATADAAAPPPAATRHIRGGTAI